MNGAAKKRLMRGNKDIMNSDLSSEKMIEALNLWKAAVSLSERLKGSETRVENVTPLDIINWV